MLCRFRQSINLYGNHINTLPAPPSSRGSRSSDPFAFSRGNNLVLEPRRCVHRDVRLDGAGHLVELGRWRIGVRHGDGLRHSVGGEV